MAPLREYALVAAALAATTALGLAFFPALTSLSVGLLYLLAIIAMSLRVGRWPMVVAGLSSAVLWDYFFVPPRFTLRVDTFQDTLMVAIYVVLASVAGQAAARIRDQAHKEKLSAESERLHRTLLESVSHELRTPLAVLTGGLESLETADQASAAALLAEMRTAAKRLNRRVGDLLDQSRLESGGLRPRMDWCDPSDLVQAAISEASDALGGHPVQVNVPDDMPPVRADFGLTRQALSNLVLNAALHTPPGTPIAIQAGRAGDGARVFFKVEDRGPGLSPAVRARLFERFVRGDRSRAGGLGLGLPIARGFVAAQGGELVLEEAAPVGTAFAIYLPHREPQPDPGE